jgi:acyl carrier protein
VDDKIRAILAKFLKLAPEQIGPGTAIGQVDGWDSTVHMRIMFAIEDAFGIELDERRIVAMTSFPRICDTVRELTATSPA